MNLSHPPSFPLILLPSSQSPNHAMRSVCVRQHEGPSSIPEPGLTLQVVLARTRPLGRVALLARAAFPSARRLTALHEFSSSSKSSYGEFDFPSSSSPETHFLLKSSIENGETQAQSQKKKAQDVHKDIFSVISSPTKFGAISASENDADKDIFSVISSATKSGASENASWKKFSSQASKRDDWGSLLEDSQSEFKEIKDSLDAVRAPKVMLTTRFLGDQEMAFVNRTQKQIVYVPPKERLLEKYFSEEQLQSKDHLKLAIAKLKKEFQMHDHDCGSTQVQIAILTAWINNLSRHLREGPNFRRDKHSRKGFNDMIQHRRRLLIYLRRRDWDMYCNVLTKLNLGNVKQASKGGKRKNVRVNR